MTPLRIALCALPLCGAALLSGCQKEGCLGGEDGCQVASPCQSVTFTCDGDDTLEVKVLEAGDDFPGGMDALGSAGDIVLRNGHVTAVIAAIGNQNGVDPNGGTVIDLAVTGADNDGINVIAQTTGLLPRDALRYTRLEIIDERPARVAVQAEGTLDGYPGTKIYTLYELRPCDRGLRLRTEALNGWNQPQTWALGDVFYWQDREAISFSPAPGLGFAHPELTLTGANAAFRGFPYLAAANHVAPWASYAQVSCNVETMEGLNNDFISLSGVPRAVIPPRDYRVFERFFLVEEGDDVATAADTALEVRSQAFGESFVTVTGTVERVGGGKVDSPRETSVVIYEGTAATAPEERIPWTQVVPAADGTFAARVPEGVDLWVEVYSYGRKVVEKEAGRAEGDPDLGTFTLPATTRVTINVTRTPGNAPLTALVYVIPEDPDKVPDYKGDYSGHDWISVADQCAPWLGPEWGGSPACNRILVEDGTATVEVPMGSYHFYAFKGPFWTIARSTHTLTDADLTLDLALEELPLQPAQSLTADLHVHSGPSFDSSMPQRDRILSFDATDLQVVVASEHDVAWDFQQTIEALGLDDRMSSIPGVETTAQIPFLEVPGDAFPRVIGHYIFFPIRVDLDKPRNGGPMDDLVEPGILFDRVKPLFANVDREGVRLLPHPWGGPYFGRDTGWHRAVHLDLTKDLPETDDGTRAGLFIRTPGETPNDGHDVQEVMNGTDNSSLPAYRAAWFYMLNQGKLKGGMANSDSHSLTDNTVGVPRNVIFTSTQAGPSFDVAAFDEAVREGRSFGTNGPVIEATVTGGTGAPVPYSTVPFEPPADAKVQVKVSAAPWVPVEEIRFVVNGQTVKTLSGADLVHPQEPFGNQDLVRFDGEVPLDELLAGVEGDAWLVIEAGDPLQLVGDLGGGLLDGTGCGNGVPDGVPDTSDNNGDGKVDCADVDAPEENTNGPLNRPPTPMEETDPGFHFARVVPDGFPYAFTNPFALDRDGDGFEKPGVGGEQ